MPNYTPQGKASFGRRVRKHVRDRSKNRGGMSHNRALGVRWGNRWSPPKDTPTNFRLMPGGYSNIDGGEAEYFMYVEHFATRANRGFICSRTWAIEGSDLVSTGGKCLACREIEDGAKDIGTTLKHVFNGLHLAYYHLVPQFEDNGKPKMKDEYNEAGQKTGKQVQVKYKEPCLGRRCDLCKEKVEKVFGKKVHWSMGSGHLEAFTGFIVEVEKQCVCGGDLEPILYECGNCAHAFIDMETTDLDDAQLNDRICEEEKCPKCGHFGLMLEQFECSSESCEDPEPTSIFDVDLSIKRHGEGTNSTVQVVSFKRKELSEDLITLYREPYKFDQIFTGDPLDIQAKILRVDNPYGKEEVKEHSEGYEEEGEEKADYGA